MYILKNTESNKGLSKVISDSDYESLGFFTKWRYRYVSNINASTRSNPNYYPKTYYGDNTNNNGLSLLEVVLIEEFLDSSQQINNIQDPNTFQGFQGGDAGGGGSAGSWTPETTIQDNTSTTQDIGSTDSTQNDFVADSVITDNGDITTAIESGNFS